MKPVSITLNPRRRAAAQAIAVLARLSLLCLLVSCQRPPEVRVVASPAAPTSTHAPSPTRPSPQPRPTNPAPPPIPLATLAPVPLPPGLSGHVAFLDDACRFVTIDLASGTRWVRATPSGRPAPEDPPCAMTAADARSWLPQPPAVPPTPAEWATGPEWVVRARNGQTAWVEPFSNGAQLHLQDGPTTLVRSYALGGPNDRYYGLLSYVADDTKLLGASWHASSGTMTDGVFYLLIDPRDGAVRELGIRAHTMLETLDRNLGDDRLVAIALSDSRNPEIAQDCRLLALDAQAVTMSCISEQLVRTPLWSPDGRLLAFADRTGQVVLRQATSPAARYQVLPLPARETGLIAWVDAEWLLVLLYSQENNLAHDEAMRPGKLQLASVRTGQLVQLADCVGLPRCYPVCGYRSVAVYLPPAPAAR